MNERKLSPCEQFILDHPELGQQACLQAYVETGAIIGPQKFWECWKRVRLGLS